MKWVGHIACMRYENWIQNLIEKPAGVRHFGRPARRWDYDKKMDLEEII
jgi:hypothetical protein